MQHSKCYSVFCASERARRCGGVHDLGGESPGEPGLSVFAADQAE